MSELSTGAVDDAVAGLTFDAAGLLPAVVQDDTDGAVLMVAWMDAEAVRRTLTTGRTWFWSRSRRRYWQKGETSGNVQHVRSVTADCDGDSLLVRVEQVGVACHTGTRSCFSDTLVIADGTRLEETTSGQGPVHRGGDQRPPEPPWADHEPAGAGS
ncbi:MAG TPA: phosphoribosyl-AMP cyclohydrolase [Actinomycetes bacterium]|nr:phosphoribosyl-AMP cyclohydrolase [Actinomycetes bacterium]